MTAGRVKSVMSSSKNLYGSILLGISDYNIGIGIHSNVIIIHLTDDCDGDKRRNDV